MRFPFDPRAAFAATCAFVAFFCYLVPAANGHGFAGDRFFPPTITTDDPFAADELALPTLSYFKNPGSPQTQEVDLGFEFDKLILPNLSLGVSDTHAWLKPDGGRGTSGWSNLEVNFKYSFFNNAPHETIISAGLVAEIGGTGAKRIGADSSTTYRPTLYFGKGFGDLPDALAYFKPFAITGNVGQTMPTHADPNVFEWGLSVQYQLPYLQSHVKDIGLPKPFRDMIPLVEFSMESPENRHGGQTTGTINPGVLWESKYFQVGVEALIPVNRASGSRVGGIFQIWIFLDDLNPKLFGHPMFGR